MASGPDYHPAPPTGISDGAHRGLVESLQVKEGRQGTSSSRRTTAGGSRADGRDAGEEEEEGEMSDSELFDELEKELDDVEGFDVGAFRERRLEQLREEIAQHQRHKETQHGMLSEITSEKELVDVMSKTKFVVVHFYHVDFRRCKIMDKHLEALAPHHFNTRFVRVAVENAPFMVDRLSIRVLPCVICFVSGQVKDKVVGFEDLGNSDNFNSAALEWRLGNAGVLIARRPGGQESILGYAAKRTEQVEDDGWDD